ncbi:MAG: Crp/Fnr family transcriptional regulator [Phormidesmis sp.]
MTQKSARAMAEPFPRKIAATHWATELTQKSFLFKGLDSNKLAECLKEGDFSLEKLYSSRPIYTAYLPDAPLDHLYVILEGGPVVVRSAPLDRIIALTYAGGCFGMLDLELGDRHRYRGFPSLVEAYKTTDALKISASIIQKLCHDSEPFQLRYSLLFELREKFQYHLLNCSTYPPQAVAALLRALIYQERTLGHQPQFSKDKPEKNSGIFCFDLPVDIIAKSCQLNHRTVEQVLKGMTKVGLLKENSKSDAADLVQVRDPEGMKAVYGATRDKVDWWPLR